MQFQIRRLTNADEPFLWEMLYQAIFIPPGQSPLPRDILETPELHRYVENWGAQGDLGVAAIPEGKRLPVGAAWVRLLRADARGYGWVDDETPEMTIAVLPEYRGQGVGGRMLNQLAGLARVRYRAISLSVSAGNPARRLYHRCGFQLVFQDEYSATMKKDLTHSDDE